MDEPAQTRRTLNQIVDPAGGRHTATATSNLWVGAPGVFSTPTEGNLVEAFAAGKAYFASLIAACDAATQEICILGWQVNWDALLAPGVRLWDLLHRAATRGVMVYVMPWNDSNPVQTYDDQTKAALQAINTALGLTRSARRVHVVTSSSWAPKNRAYFSHHQKLVVVDRRIAFVGGIDLAYGRYDDDSFTLRADADGRQVLNRYNGCVPPMATLRQTDPTLVDPDLLSGALDNASVPLAAGPNNAQMQRERIAGGGWQVPYGDSKRALAADFVGAGPAAEGNPPRYTILDATTQPRLPWQDIHSRIEGPAVSDLLRNFVLRWNASGGTRLALPEPPARYAKPGTAQVQVLRSAPAAMGQAEYNARSPKAGANAPAGTEDHIHRAMLQLIEKSNRFIYIENQFFVSEFGRQQPEANSAASPAARYIATRHRNQQSGADAVSFMDEDARMHIGRNGWKPELRVDTSALYPPPSNRICQALVARIQRAILDVKAPHYHVYITLPVHSEGMLDTMAIAIQVYWTQQTLSFGSRSLLNGVRRALKARALRDAGDAQYMRVIEEDASTEYESVPLSACDEYVTLLNLRNWAQLGERYVTEQVYVHSKLMLVDDLYALLGSANVNDRSLLGERDSELAVLVMDTDASRADINGTGSQRPVRRFAHELRKQVWRKLFGISAGVRPATELAQAVEQPGSPASWRAIQARARANTKVYEAVFPTIPRSESIFQKGRPASILPGFNATADAPLGAAWGRAGLHERPMPFEERYWTSAQFDNGQVDALTSIKGFVCQLPVDWGRGEHNRFDYPSMLVVDADRSPAIMDTKDSVTIGEARVLPAAGPRHS